METYMIIILVIVAIIIFWKPLSVCRKEIPEGLTIGIKHGTKVLKLNVMEDELELQERARKVKEAHANKDQWVDLDNLWNDMHPSNK